MENKSRLNIDRVPNELKIMLELIKSENMEDLQPFPKNIDWRNFVELVMHHRVYPLVFLKLNGMNKELLPAFVIQSMENAYKRNTFYMLQLSGEMERICELLNGINIPVLVLKGPVLGVDLYGDLSQRTSGDLDILIPINDLDKAENLLLERGYRKDDYIKTVLNDWRWRHHHVTFFHAETGFKLEIHWRLNPGPGKEPNFNELWDRKRQSSLTSYPIYYLGKEDLFLFLVSHGARHGWSRLRWLIDIDRLVKQNPDWSILNKLLGKYQFLHIGGQAVTLAASLLNTPITMQMAPLFKGNRANRMAQKAVFYLEEMINLHSDPVPADVSSYHKNYLFMLMSKKQRIFFTISFLYPYPEDAETLPLPKRLHFLYFPLRPFLWIWRRSRNHALS